MKKQAHAYYVGDVQGVGFRYTAQDIARNLKVCGWIRNLEDGRVELLAEAEKERLEEFLGQIHERFLRYIRSRDVEWLQASGEFRDFQITF